MMIRNILAVAITGLIVAASLHFAFTIHVAAMNYSCHMNKGEVICSPM